MSHFSMLMMSFGSRVQVFLLGVCFFAGAACQHAAESLQVGDPQLLEEIECIAVAPLVNASNQPDANKILESLLHHQLIIDHFYGAIESADVRSILRHNAMNPENLPADPKALVAAGRLLQVQGILSGTIREYGYRSNANQENIEPGLVMDLNLYHLPTGILVWSFHADRTSPFLTSRQRDSLSQLATSTAQEAVALLRRHSARQQAAGNPSICGAELK